MIKNSPSLGEGVASDFAENQAIVFSMYFKSRNAQPFTMKRRIKGIAAAIAAFSVLAVGSPIVASAQSAGVPNAVDITNQIRNDTWKARNDLHKEAEKLDPNSAQKAKELVDGAANAVAPGIVDEKNKEAQEAKDRAEAERLAKERENFDYGSCPPTAAACVDLTKQRTWLQKNGKVFGPARDMSSGAVGWETPKGTHRVVRKVKNEVSRPFNNAPTGAFTFGMMMPFSISTNSRSVTWYTSTKEAERYSFPVDSSPPPTVLGRRFSYASCGELLDTRPVGVVECRKSKVTLPW